MRLVTRLSTGKYEIRINLRRKKKEKGGVGEREPPTNNYGDVEQFVGGLSRSHPVVSDCRGVPSPP